MRDVKKMTEDAGIRRLLIVVDMQNDFIDGTLGTPQARRILPSVKAKIDEYKENGDDVLFTRDTHRDDYPETQEGALLPIVHCIEGTYGHKISEDLDTCDCTLFDKPTFGSLQLAEHVAAGNYDEIELCGLCTDICVVSNAIILKARLPETKIIVDAGCCAGTDEDSHMAALLTMKACQVDLLNNDQHRVLGNSERSKTIDKG
jgi:nicotinamidase-related amidase